ncbi:predicted protein [Uncinocarpus reesii 1704]|uniref:Uncharacterized protein n=1 Tax=Uncinocarpus reesii (strain UAMH 1704) TaxID=336963 RepID=C4JR00_UNCRE|nr:uncharacterized protein UREG_03482 [Uncinocarpus reesii 1704]EEP78636.1 predicted protein [Uncinocarpus reesii 1704]
MQGVQSTPGELNSKPRACYEPGHNENVLVAYDKQYSERGVYTNMTFSAFVRALSLNLHGANCDSSLDIHALSQKGNSIVVLCRPAGVGEFRLKCSPIVDGISMAINGCVASSSRVWAYTQKASHDRGDAGNISNSPTLRVHEIVAGHGKIVAAFDFLGSQMPLGRNCLSSIHAVSLE